MEEFDAGGSHGTRRAYCRLPSAYEDDDLAAKQFDYLILLSQLAMLRADPSFAGLSKRVTGIAAKLELLGNVPMVAAEMALILE